MIIHSHDYDSRYNPAMPTIEIRLRGRSEQEPLILKAIVDSGADATMIPLTYLKSLQVRKGARKWVSGIAGVRYEADLYLVSLQIGNDKPHYTEVIGTTRREEVIIGRDLLNQYNISLNAPAFTVQVIT